MLFTENDYGDENGNSDTHIIPGDGKNANKHKTKESDSKFL